MRMSSVVPRIGSRLRTGCAQIRLLLGGWLRMPLVPRRAFHWCRLVANTVGAPVVCHSSAVHNRVLLDDGSIHIGVTNDGRIHPRDGRVVLERATSPHAAHI